MITNDDEMLVEAVEYWGGVTTDMSDPRTRDLTSAVTADTPLGGEKRGTAHLRGLDQLLQSPNRLPVGDGSSNIAVYTAIFDCTLARVNNITAPWQEQKDNVIRYFYNVYNHNPDVAVQQSQLNGTRDLDTSFAIHKMRIAALLVFAGAYGWEWHNEYRRKSLLLMAQIPQNQTVHHFFVLPMLFFICTEMNPNGNLDLNYILEMNLARVPNYIRNNTKRFGIWSQEELVRRLSLDTTNPANAGDLIDALDKPMLSGIEFQFARMYSLIVSNFTKPYCFQRQMYDPDKLWITQQENGLLYQQYSALVVRRVPMPNFWWFRNG
jgi:hypothetical protein